MIAESLAARARKKVVASESASKARVYKGLADVSVPFFGEEEQGSDTKNPELLKAIRDYEWSGLCSDVEAPPGIEPGVRVLQTPALPLGYGAA